MKRWLTAVLAGALCADACAQGLDLFEQSSASRPRLRREMVETARPGDVLRVTLGSPRTLHVTSSNMSKLGTRIVRARIDGLSGGSLLLALHGSATAGAAWVSPTERYRIDAESMQTEPPPTLPLCACAADRPRPRATPRRIVSRDSAAPRQFDVLLVYTPAALAAEGSVDMLTAQADLAMADANVCYKNSGIAIEGRIVAVRPVQYVESGEIHTDLHHLVFPDDGALDEVQAYRDEAQADFVCLFTRRDSADGFRGYADILTALAPDAEVLAFSVVDVQAATIDHLFAHELGHNMGCDHDRENTTGLHLYGFSFGWRFKGKDGVLYRDVMAYAPGASVPYFGNPEVSYQGTPTGVADYSDTARTLQLSAPAFVNFRAADGIAQVSVRARTSKSADDPQVKFVFERTGGVTQPLTVAYQAGGSAAPGVTYAPLPGTVVFAANSHFAKVLTAPKADAPPFGAATLELTVQPGNGYAPADSPSGAAIAASATLEDRLPLIGLGPVHGAPGRLKVPVERLGPSAEDVVVKYRLGGTAVPGVDYQGPDHGKLRIPAGADRANLVLTLGSATDHARTIEVTLISNPSYNLGAMRVVAYSF